MDGRDNTEESGYDKREEAGMNKLELDIRGQICPSSLLFTLREVDKHAQQLQDGELSLSVKTDNRDAINTIPQALGNMGYIVNVTKLEGYYQIDISSDL